MVNSQEIIERSVYSALLHVAMALGYTVDPNNYLPASVENANRFKEDIQKLKRYIPIFGTANSSSKDKKTTPRIVVNARGFYPGMIGLPKEIIGKVGQDYTMNEEPYETLDQYIDIHLVANTQEEIRLLHIILFSAIPQRGYIKPYTSDKMLPSGNIFLEVGNFFDYPNNTLGLMEKVYEFRVYDTLIGEKEDLPVDWVPIKDIQVVLDEYHDNHILLDIHSDILGADFNEDFNLDYLIDDLPTYFNEDFNPDYLIHDS